jgi:hypothetical protein
VDKTTVWGPAISADIAEAALSADNVSSLDQGLFSNWTSVVPAVTFRRTFAGPLWTGTKDVPSQASSIVHHTGWDDNRPVK